MRAITIRQPWAELILRGEKDVENRSWRTRHRGLLLIHAGLGADKVYFEEYDVRADVDRGAIIGVVELVECTKKRTSDWHARGSWGWYLIRPRRFKKPIQMKGRLGLFEVPERKIPKHVVASHRSTRPVQTKNARSRKRAL